jgi:hypothetical protein
LDLLSPETLTHLHLAEFIPEMSKMLRRFTKLEELYILYRCEDEEHRDIKNFLKTLKSFK